ncbi:hypothetical protein [Streptomyces pimonensis]|uniref:hypothetical protein n=1 Tax=Streptomyces pimonensis TaxID=2860288 RepID=UPI003527DF62
MTQPFPPIEPYAHGLLEVGDGNRIHWKTSGNPDGKAALCVRGGPSSGGRRGSRTLSDPEVHRISSRRRISVSPRQPTGEIASRASLAAA